MTGVFFQNFLKIRSRKLNKLKILSSQMLQCGSHPASLKDSRDGNKNIDEEGLLIIMHAPLRVSEVRQHAAQRLPNINKVKKTRDNHEAASDKHAHLDELALQK